MRIQPNHTLLTTLSNTGYIPWFLRRWFNYRARHKRLKSYCELQHGLEGTLRNKRVLLDSGLIRNIKHNLLWLAKDMLDIGSQLPNGNLQTKMAVASWGEIGGKPLLLHIKPHYDYVTHWDIEYPMAIAQHLLMWVTEKPLSDPINREVASVLLYIALRSMEDILDVNPNTVVYWPYSTRDFI